MSDDWGFAPPPFDAEQALVQLRRALRDLQLAERGNGAELRGKRVVEWQVDGSTIQLRIARRLAITPEWDKATLRSAADQRKWVDEIKKRLARWQNDD
ncbi:MAG: hypothetical protein JNJ42_07970 [Burkholderiaceae bacterium]|jgi:hypothetical protein|nr:hypothetical protein [Burkholderiaceae bacterium]